MKIYSNFGIQDFIICAGYKGYIIKEYFANYFLHLSDVTFDMSKNSIEVHSRKAEPWRVTVIDTGDETQTGGRLSRVREYLRDQSFCFTYGDGVADIDIGNLIQFHRETGKLATLTAVQPPGRYGALTLDDHTLTGVTSFQEKPVGDGAWVNGGFFVLEPGVLEYIDQGDATIWERGPLASLAQASQLSAYRHRGFWRPMDTLRDKNELEALWSSGKAPWKCWS